MVSARSYSGTAAQTSLLSGMNASALTFTVQTGGGAGYPDGTGGPFFVTLDMGLTNEEKVLCSARSGDVFTIVTRGADGTSSSSHQSNASVHHTWTAVDAAEANQHHVATTDVHGATGSVVGTGGTQTLTGKTLVNPTLTGGTVNTAQLNNTTLGGNTTATGPVRVTSATDVSLTSVDHPLQVGPTSGLNIAVDGNEIQARNNGDASRLAVNAEGGYLFLGPDGIRGDSMAFGTFSSGNDEHPGLVYHQGSVQVFVNFTTPPSGRFAVVLAGSLDGELNAGTDTACLSYEVREGHVLGSGTVVVAASDASALLVQGVNAMQLGRTNYHSLTGLTDYHVRTMHRNGPGTGGVIRYRQLTVEPKL